MTATFTKIGGVPTVYRWPANPELVAVSMNWSKRIPHDMGHWFMEAQVDLPWGFWSLAAQQAPFASFELVKGRWPKERVDWYRRVVRKHGESMLHAEAQDGLWLTDPSLDVHAQWPEIRDRLARTYAFADSPLSRFGPSDVEKLRPFAMRAAKIWSDLPDGGSVQVTWPGANHLEVVPTETHSVLPYLETTVLAHNSKDGTRLLSYR